MTVAAGFPLYLDDWAVVRDYNSSALQWPDLFTAWTAHQLSYWPPYFRLHENNMHLVCYSLVLTCIFPLKGKSTFNMFNQTFTCIRGLYSLAILFSLLQFYYRQIVYTRNNSHGYIIAGKIKLNVDKAQLSVQCTFCRHVLVQGRCYYIFYIKRPRQYCGFLWRKIFNWQSFFGCCSFMLLMAYDDWSETPFCFSFVAEPALPTCRLSLPEMFWLVILIYRIQALIAATPSTFQIVCIGHLRMPILWLHFLTILSNTVTPYFFNGRRLFPVFSLHYQPLKRPCEMCYVWHFSFDLAYCSQTGAQPEILIGGEGQTRTNSQHLNI